MIVAGDRVVAHLRFRGHFTGRFGQIQGQGAMRPLALMNSRFERPVSDQLEFTFGADPHQ
jgi:hypothetical protein